MPTPSMSVQSKLLRNRLRKLKRIEAKRWREKIRRCRVEKSRRPQLSLGPPGAVGLLMLVARRMVLVRRRAILNFSGNGEGSRETQRQVLAASPRKISSGGGSEPRDARKGESIDDKR